MNTNRTLSLFEDISFFALLTRPRFLLFLILPVRWFAFLMRFSMEAHNGR